jgi:hypothetical protein
MRTIRPASSGSLPRWGMPMLVNRQPSDLIPTIKFYQGLTKTIFGDKDAVARDRGRTREKGCPCWDIAGRCG